MDKTVVHDNHEECNDDTQIKVNAKSNTITEQRYFNLKCLRKRRVDIPRCFLLVHMM